MNNINICIAGLGNVGSALVQIIEKNGNVNIILSVSKDKIDERIYIINSSRINDNILIDNFYRLLP